MSQPLAGPDPRAATPARGCGPAAATSPEAEHAPYMKELGWRMSTGPPSADSLRSGLWPACLTLGARRGGGGGGVPSGPEQPPSGEEGGGGPKEEDTPWRGSPHLQHRGCLASVLLKSSEWL